MRDRREGRGRECIGRGVVARRGGEGGNGGGNRHQGSVGYLTLAFTGRERARRVSGSVQRGVRPRHSPPRYPVGQCGRST